MTHTMKEWSHPSNYVGTTWEGWFSAGFGQSRDSDCLEASNFAIASETLLALQGEMHEDDHIDNLNADEGYTSVRIVRENHWAVGWVEWIAIHSSNVAALTKARELCERANSYPVLDEDDFSRREDEECAETWEKCFNTRDRIDYLRRHSYTAQSLTDILQAVRTGSWYHAASILHSPSDLLY